MFSFFKRRAQTKAAERAAIQADVDRAVHAKLSGEIAEILAAAIAKEVDDSVSPAALEARAAAIQSGVDLVLLEGADAYGPALSGRDHPTRLGAMLAHGARNLTIVTHSLNHPDSRGDIRHGMGLPRDGGA